MKLKGVFAAIVTPITNNEEIDDKGIRKIINYELKAGVNGLYALGSMGAFDILNKKAAFQALEIICNEVKGRVPIIAGISDTSVKRVIENYTNIKGLPIDYYSILTPYKCNLSQKEIKIFYTNIAKSVDKPIIMYNSITGISIMTVDTIKELSEIANISGIKSNFTDQRLYMLSEYFKNREDFTYFSSVETYAFDALLYGADAIIGGIIGLAPKIAVDMYNSLKTGDYKRAFESQKRIAGLLDIINYGDLWGGMEAAYNILKIPIKITGKPHYTINSKKDLSQIKNILDKYYYN